MRLLSPAHFKSLARKGERRTDVALRKEIVSSVVAVGERILRFTISTPSIDRENDVIALDGWELENYRRNPVVLWGHEQHCLPIGRAIALDIEDGALKASVEFVPAETPHIGDKAEAVLQLCKLGFLSATSVGFRPLEFVIAADRDEGDGWFPPMNFMRQELLEFSIVTVPANAEALIEVPDFMLQETLNGNVVDPAADAARAVQQAEEKSAADALAKQVQDARLAVAKARRAHRFDLDMAF